MALLISKALAVVLYGTFSKGVAPGFGLQVVYRLRRHWKDGTAAVAFDPLTFIERLAALVPRPRCHQLTYHGVLAPAAPWRDLVVPSRAATPGTTPHPSIPRLPWAELLKRVFAIDALTCPWCGGPRKLIALLTDGLVVRLSRVRAKALPWGDPLSKPPQEASSPAPPSARRIEAYLLSHLDFPTEPLPLAPARAPPDPAFAW